MFDKDEVTQGILCDVGMPVIHRGRWVGIWGALGLLSLISFYNVPTPLSSSIYGHLPRDLSPLPLNFSPSQVSCTTAVCLCKGARSS